MAETKLANMIVPSVFMAYTAQRTTELTAFIQSGIMQDLSTVLATLLQGGTTVNMPYFNDLTGEDEVLDDRYNLSVNNVTTGQDVAVRLIRGKVFGASDLSADISGADPMRHIADRFAAYWSRRIQAIALAVVKGAMATTASGASMAGNTLDISALSGAAAYFDGESFIDATHRLGDHADGLRGVAVHSDTLAAMKKADLIEYIKPSDGEDEVPTYQGKRVVVDDAMPKLSGGIYHSYVFGPGALGFAQADPEVPVETGREPLQGGGMEYIVQRRQYLVHPRGVKWAPGGGVPAKATPSNTELGTATNWARIYDAKDIRIVRFIHKLAA
ncbi:methyltransferase [Chelatococcus asaccharovorans]|uniref:Coat protein n=1 Tax=Chelatococcus asaccharovorans TaxID=28210 RepID=A0A2V3UAU3_9HYPH|nr:methyltransferase [Chelatococcus asaccharovorans]MBS7703311.1 coat protein [Chelatococcus asaccharovorans]PXW61644.1 hypothetical protein C7450_103161 [Chelatococcus asaccharovorans]